MQFLLLLRKYFFTIISLTVLMLSFSDAATLRLRRTIKWNDYPNTQKGEMIFPHFLTFPAANHTASSNWLPYWGETIRLNTKAKNISVTIQNPQFTNTYSAIQNQASLKPAQSLEVNFSAGLEVGKSAVMVRFLPVSVQNSADFQLVHSFEIVITYETDIINTASLGKKPFNTNSVLASGEWYRIAVTQTGFHKLDASFFAAAGIDVSSIDPRSIKIFGNGAGLIPQRNSDARIDDLKENGILVAGESDGTFNSQDYVLFYGKSQQDVWKQSGTQLVREKNIFSDTTYYFLTFNQGTGKRITKQPSSPTPISNENTHVFCYAHELDQSNIGRTGKQFVGEAFDKTPEQSFPVTINGFIPSEPAHLLSSVAARSNISTPVFSVRLNGNEVLNHTMQVVGTSYESPYFSRSGPLSADFSAPAASFALTYRYNLPPGGSIGWLDFFEINTKANMTWYGNQVIYRLLPPTNPGYTTYTISNASANPRLFNVTDETAVEEFIVTSNGGQASITHNVVSFSELAGFNDASTFLNPVSINRMRNQNLHGLAQVDVLYITPPEFYQEAMRLAAFHQNSGLSAHVINIRDIYNEFSGGAQDITAIRDFIRMFYSRASSASDRIKYVTLFGRASYDYKYRVTNNSNFVPTFQSNESSSPVASYCSDDFYGFLDDGEGGWDIGNDTKEMLDIGIGRLPISNETEARNAVDKIINYHKADRMGNWRNKVVFVCDDEDGNIHQRDANEMADNLMNTSRNYNVQKIWIDAYREEVIAGGQRYPEAQKAISDAVQKGTFVVNYTGHGGELGWAAERILTIEDINSWTNSDRLPLFVTATCEFSRFDDPARISAGELTFLSTKGGTIALLTTVRLVNAYSNTVLNKAFYRRSGLDSTSKINPLPLGEIMRLTKNDYTGGDRNERNFTLLGDAVMTLAYPKLNVVTTSINNKPIIDVTDTLKALTKVTITGAVTDLNGQVVTSYNGEVLPTVYDKTSIYQTLVNNPSSSPALDFKMQNNIIYSGNATVTNGVFTYSFIVPKDIAYQVGRGKISYYAHDMKTDANGFNENFLVGGTADSIGSDVVGPEMRLYMNDEKFVFGGMTNENPLFIAKLFDQNGINTIGRGIGRELSLTIDNDVARSVAVNDYYQAQKDSYTEGEVKYQLKNLEAGKHTATLKAWDTYNNSNESTLEFIVANNENLALQYVLNYPNPFTTNTTFHFDHNKSGEDLTVMIQVFTVSGKLAKTLSTQVTAATTHFADLKWDGLDDYGDKLGKGVYIYKVKVKSLSGKTAEATQKLVILN